MLILTVPHVCYDILGISDGKTVRVQDPTCDQNAHRYADIIKEENPDAILIKSRTTRTICDNNRKQCRNTSMRKRLRQKMKKHESDFTVIDIHSFPNGESYSVLGEPDVVLLDTYTSDEYNLLFDLLESNNIFVVGLIGDEMNDIQAEAREYGGRAILIELHYDLPDATVIKIGKIIAGLPH